MRFVIEARAPNWRILESHFHLRQAVRRARRHYAKAGCPKIRVTDTETGKAWDVSVSGELSSVNPNPIQ